jgi:hypothetical protein
VALQRTQRLLRETFQHASVNTMFGNGMLKVREYCKQMTTRLAARRAACRTGRERACERRPMPLDILNTLCSISQVALNVDQAASRNWALFALAVGCTACAAIVTYDCAGRGERGITCCILGLSITKTDGCRCWWRRVTRGRDCVKARSIVRVEGISGGQHAGCCVGEKW